MRSSPPAGLLITVEAPDALPHLPAAVEVAAYYIVVEALNNVVRHAQATRCRVELSAAEHLAVVVADDGVGLPEQYRAGVGLHSIRERAAELGGTSSVQPALGGGTVVRAWLPIEGHIDG
jgi:signal transduction histidine kinase